MDTKNNQKTQRSFTDAEKHHIIQELLSSRRTKQDIWEQYTGETEEHGRILEWMKKLGYNVNYRKRPNIVRNSNMMAKQQKKKTATPTDESFEILQLKKRNLELEKQLKDAELKAVAFSAMVDIAEKEFKIPIRKKFNTKP
jgi:transposase